MAENQISVDSDIFATAVTHTAQYQNSGYLRFLEIFFMRSATADMISAPMPTGAAATFSLVLNGLYKDPQFPPADISPSGAQIIGEVDFKDLGFLRYQGAA